MIEFLKVFVPTLAIALLLYGGAYIAAWRRVDRLMSQRYGDNWWRKDRP